MSQIIIRQDGPSNQKKKKSRLTCAWKFERSELSPPTGIPAQVRVSYPGFISTEFIFVSLKVHVHKQSVWMQWHWMTWTPNRGTTESVTTDTVHIEVVYFLYTSIRVFRAGVHAWCQTGTWCYASRSVPLKVKITLNPSDWDIAHTCRITSRKGKYQNEI